MKLRTLASTCTLALALGTSLSLLAQEEPPDPNAQPAPGARGAGRGGRGGGGGRGAVNPEVIAKAAAGAPQLPPGPVQPTWESLKANYQTPEWIKDGKFGIFLHWGLYAVPAHGNEWYVQHMYSGGGMTWHVQKFGPVDKFGYKDFIPMFKAEKWDPDAWITLFKKAGAKYVIPAAEHHDGFAMWDSALTKWDAKDMGPKRDLIGDLATAARKQGMHFGVSNHRMEHYSFIRVPDVPSDLTDPAYQDFYWTMNHSDALYQKFLEDWVARNFELIDKYRPEMLWFDNGVNSRALDPVKLKVASYYYNRARERGQQVTLSTKGHGQGAAYLAATLHDLERGRPVGIEEDWQEDTSIAHNSWGYNEDPLQIRNAGELIRELVDCVSKNGNYLLNLAPRADGTIPENQQLRLLEIGDWLGVNGEAIYGTRAWSTFGEGPTSQGEPRGDRGLTDGMLKVYTARDMRFTTKGDTLYAILYAWPYGDEPAVITSLATGKAPAGKIEKVEMLGVTRPLQFTQDEKGLTVKMPTPPIKPCDFAYVLKITGLKLK
jgi:alpha-L-fucosidase